MRVGLISDTHLANLAEHPLDRAIAVWGELDLILHAGDMCCREVLDYLGQHAQTLAVAGNVDSFRDAVLCPPHRIVTCGKVRIGLLHGDGDTSGAAIWQRALRRFDGKCLNVIVHGHSHEPLVHAKGGIVVVNPGSTRNNRCGSPPTVGLLEIRGAKVTASILEL